MDSPDTGTPNPLEAKSDIVNSIIATDKKAFYEWSTDLNNKGKLAIPEPALRYMVITPRILELADNPSAVGLDIAGTTPDRTGALVVEHKSTPITNEDSRRRYLDKRAEFLKREKAKQGNPMIFLIPKTGGPTVPNDVDSYHVNEKYLKLIEVGVFSLNDRFLNNIELAISEEHPQVLFVADYRIRDSLQKRGIGTSFYERLRECARELGFRFITGQNWENNNIVYFRDKLGRSTLDQVKPERRGDFSSITTGLEQYSIDFLYPEDKPVYLPQDQ